MERDNPVNDNIVFDGNFNSHAHVERDPIVFVFTPLFVYFNSHAHVERDVALLLTYSM